MEIRVQSQKLIAEIMCKCVMHCYTADSFPLDEEVPKTKTKTVSTKLSELSQTTIYHTITYKAHTGPCPLQRTKVQN